MLASFSQLKTKYNMNISGVIHIGAHYGEEIPEYLKNAIQNIVVFEPLSKNFDILEKNLVNLNADIKGYQVALGSKKQKATMFLSDNEAQSSSILKPKVHLTHHPNVKFEGVEEVDVEVLDDYNITDCNFINIDVQGYELEVFKGSSKTLNYVDYIYCEVNRGEMYEGNAMIDEVDEFLSSYKFKRVETFWPEEWFQWGDALYVKEK